MKRFAIFLLLVSSAAAEERLGAVSFATSCSASQQEPFNRGVALLHDFWYEEAQHQFEQIALADSSCALAHWGVAMSRFHQIWGRPDAKTMDLGWQQMRKAQAANAKTAREREYVTALGIFYKPGKADFESRASAYSAAMATLYQHYSDDVDAGAFYALSLLAATPRNDTSLNHNREALAVLTPWFAKNPDHPGVVHYIIHACDTPALAPQGLAAARHYGEIAASAPHAVHMPGHIFARLGMWQADIDSNVASVAASQSAEARHLSGAFDQLHADDFLLYAYLQSGQDAQAKAILEKTSALMTHFETMPGMTDHGMGDMLPYYRTELTAIYQLEMRNWQAAAELKPIGAASSDLQAITYWARTLATARLHQPDAAAANLAAYDGLMEQVKKGKFAYVAASTFQRIRHGEMLAWVAFSQGNQEGVLKQMRETADLQDKVGQGEVDIPAREMLADMLLEFHQPQQALTEYEKALTFSPNRLNGLFQAGLAAEAAGDKARANKYYATIMKITGNGSQSERPEFAHLKAFMSATQVAVN